MSKFTLYLLTKKGFDCLKYLVGNLTYKNSLSQIVIARDKGNKEDYYNEIKTLCTKEGISVFDRVSHEIKETDYGVAIGWKWLINDCKNLIVIHDSLLPKYRGFSPLVNMLINGEKTIGATAIFASKMMDEGDIITQEKELIEYPIKINDAIDIMSKIYVRIIKKIFKILHETGSLDAIPQNEQLATYSLWRDEDDYLINWKTNAVSIERFVNAVSYPYSGAITFLSDDTLLRLIEVKALPKYKFEHNCEGKIFMYKDGFPLVACKSGAIAILKAVDDSGEIYSFKRLRQKLK